MLRRPVSVPGEVADTGSAGLHLGIPGLSRASLFQRAFAESGGNLAHEKGFAAMAEILLRLHGMGAKMSEVPMVLRYDRKTGPGKMRVGQTVVRTLAILVRARSKM